MMLGQIGRALPVCLVLLLSIEFTGLNCLEDWKIAPATDAQILSAPPADGAGKADQPSDDGCPCHLAFMSVPQAAPQSYYPISLLDIGAPRTLVPGHTALPFHPPLTL